MNWLVIIAILLGAILMALLRLSVAVHAVFDLLTRWERRREKSGHP